jgi:uncharacterized membrane protein
MMGLPKRKRPVLALDWSGSDRAIEIAALLALIAVFAILAAYWPRLPERVPTKFAMDGQIKDWGSRSLLLLVPLVALATYIALTILGRFPHLYSYPVTITSQNAERHYRLGRWMLATIKLAVLLLLAAVSLAVLHSAAYPDAAAAIGAVLIIPVVLFIAFMLALAIVTILTHRRMERHSPA